MQFINALMMKLKLVFYMSNEEIFKKDDLSRELALVLQASLQTFLHLKRAEDLIILYSNLEKESLLH